MSETRNISTLQSNNQVFQNDYVAVLFSSLAGIVQFALIIISGISQTKIFENIFINSELVPILILISALTSLCLTGTYSVFKKNRNFISLPCNIKLVQAIKRLVLVDDKRNNFVQQKTTEKKLLSFLSIILVTAILIFVLTVIIHRSGTKIIFPSNLLVFYQSFSFLVISIVSSLSLYIWISDEISLKKQYKPDDFLPNFNSSLQMQGYIPLSNIKIMANISLSSNHLLKIKINDDILYFFTQFDGKNITELTEKEFYQFIPNNNETNRT